MRFSGIIKRSSWRQSTVLVAISLLAALIGPTAGAAPINHVFRIMLENHNWTQPDHKFSGHQQQIKNNPNAPYINSLINGTAPASRDVAYADAYHNALVRNPGQHSDGRYPHIHPSEPSYIWSEAGSNLGVKSDDDPYSWWGWGGTHQATHRHLSHALGQNGHTWASYQEDIDLKKNADGEVTNQHLARSRWTVPLSSHSGTSPAYTNRYNGSHQYHYAAKHDPQVLFDDTNGNGNTTPSNPDVDHYRPLSQLKSDLYNGKTADYNIITADEYNEMHSILKNGYTTRQGKHLTGEASRIAAADHFLSIIIPEIRNSPAYDKHTMIEIWMDETAGGDDFQHTIPDIVISPQAHANVDGKPFASKVNLTHSSGLKTMAEIFGTPKFRHAGDPSTKDYASMLKPGALPNSSDSGTSKP